MYLSVFMGPSAATPTQDGPLIAQCLDLAERSAAAGFAMVTFGEQHSNGYEPYCNPLLMAARLSPVLGETWFGTTVVPLPFHGVLRLAEDTSVVDVLTRGRFVLGMSAGLPFIGTGFRDFAVDPARRSEVFATKLDALLAAYRQGPGDPPLSFVSDFDTETMGGRLMPAPFRQHGPQLAVGTNTDATIDDVARRGLALFLGPCPRPEAALKIGRLRAGLADHGVDAAQIERLVALSLVTRQVVVAPTEDEAWEALEVMAGTSPLIDRREDRRTLQQMAAVPLADAESDPFPRNVRHVHSWFLAGTPETVGAELAAYGADGVPHVNVRFTIGTYRPELVERSFGLFTKEVLPGLDPQRFAAPTVEEQSPAHRPDADVFAAPPPRPFGPGPGAGPGGRPGAAAGAMPVGGRTV